MLEPIRNVKSRPADEVAWLCWRLFILMLGSFVIGLALLRQDAAAQTQSQQRHVIVELYHNGNNETDKDAQEVLAELTSRRDGLIIVHRDVRQPDNRRRLEAIAEYYRISESELPLVYGCNRVIVSKEDKQSLAARCEKMLEMEVFVRRGCPRCERARTYLVDFASRYPAVRIVYHDLVTERRAVSDLNALVRKHRKAAASVPVFHACDQLLIGFDSQNTTGRRLEEIFRKWSIPDPNKSNRDDKKAKSKDTLSVISDWPWRAPLAAYGVRPFCTASLIAVIQADAAESVPLELPLPELDGPNSEDLPVNEESDHLSTLGTAESDGEQLLVEIPWFGQIDVRHKGLFAFTFAIGLVDGFNPCAMWVLLFLLSLLVNLRSRSRIVAVAGSFVVVSALAYFAFMAAWLNVFLLIGLLRPVQVMLGLLGITVGLIHVKDFFAFKRGVSLSIPESAKPGIYARMRAIITAENLTGAIVGAVTLAVLVNIVELLCTAGLPALYTEVLASYQLPAWKNYAYLGLYIVAYMFDDSLMVAAVVFTLNKRKLQEAEGRWLKLVSGVVITALGFVVLLQPDLLM